ncbi:MAG: hypothetical protein K2P51_03030 [Rhabdochlamydiaceae bacterium]|nr:hypothetical protein [Rhabdochlamydiaceae bacterium]
MHRYLKKMWPTAAASLILLTNIAQADVDSSQLRNLDNRVSALEQKKGASGMINPPGRPQVKDGADLFVTADFIYWNAHENGLPLAVRNKGSTTNLSNADVVYLKSEWDPGFRVGVGYNLPHDGWDTTFTYLHFFTDADRHTHAQGGRADFASQGADQDSFNTKSKGHWNLHLSQLDLNLGREFFVSKWLTLRPNFGLRTAWIKQSLRARYKGFDYVPALKTKVDEKCNFWGLGVVAGMDSQWGLGSGWSIFGNAGFSLLYGFFHNDVDQNTITVNKFVDLDGSYRTSTFVADLAIGLRWDHMFDRDRYHISFQGGWEHHLYAGQNQFIRFYSNIADNNLGGIFSNQGDLTLQGWTLSARFDF